MLNEFLFDSLIIVLSFIGIIVLPYIYFYHYAQEKFKHRLIMKRFLPAKKESIMFTCLSLFIMLGLYFHILYFESLNFFSFKDHSSLPIHFITIVGLILLNDAYFYWVHFILHRFKPLKRFHEIHHRDITPTPLSAFNFHPVEALLNFAFYLIIVFLVPMTKIDFYLVYLYMLVNNSLGHMPLEFCPRWFYKYKLTSFLNAATHHIMHHRNGSTNFSLYYLFWDDKMKTMSRKYYSTFNDVQDQIDSSK